MWAQKCCQLTGIQASQDVSQYREGRLCRRDMFYKRGTGKKVEEQLVSANDLASAVREDRGKRSSDGGR